jgi:beta,beta-carotene 9',10'-dioxygenase
MDEPDATAGTGVLGFHSLPVTDERETDLPVKGSLPEWLSGTLVRNGPGSFEAGEGSVDHWFDGLAMLTRYTFDEGRVRYGNRFLRTDSYSAAEAGEFSGGFATGESTLRERLWRLLRGDTYDNTNIIVERVGDGYLALTETPRWDRVDPTTLETLGDYEYDGPAANGQLFCAHLQYDPAADVHVTFDVEFGRQNQYHVFELPAPGERDVVASVPTERPSYMHSFALTPNYAVLTEFPFDVDPLAFLKVGRQGPFIENFEWRPEEGTTIHLIDRETGAVRQTRTDPMFGFHHVNAYEDGGDVVFDLETLPDATAVSTLDLSTLRSGNLDALAGRLDRYRVSNPGGTPTVERVERFAEGTGLPTVSPAIRLDEHRFVYAQKTDQPVTEWPRGIVKLDTATNDQQVWEGPGGCSEPIFVPRPGGNGEDDGVVLSVTLDTGAERSVLIVLDGETFEERARAPLPHALPYDFHGRFFPELTPGAE